MGLPQPLLRAERPSQSRAVVEQALAPALTLALTLALALALALSLVDPTLALALALTLTRLPSRDPAPPVLTAKATAALPAEAL